MVCLHHCNWNISVYIVYNHIKYINIQTLRILSIWHHFLYPFTLVSVVLYVLYMFHPWEFFAIFSGNPFSEGVKCDFRAYWSIVQKYRLKKKNTSIKSDLSLYPSWEFSKRSTLINNNQIWIYIDYYISKWKIAIFMTFEYLRFTVIFYCTFLKTVLYLFFSRIDMILETNEVQKYINKQNNGRKVWNKK